jgi:hypothetical protein
MNSSGANSKQSHPQIISDDEILNHGANATTKKPPPKVLGDEILDGLNGGSSKKSVPPVISDDEILNTTTRKPIPEILGDEILNVMNSSGVNAGTSTRKPVPEILGDEILNGFNSSSVQSLPPIMGDDILDYLNVHAETKKKVTPPIVTDDILDSLDCSSNIPTVSAKAGSSSSARPTRSPAQTQPMPNSTKASSSRPATGQQQFINPSISHKPSNVPLIEDASLISRLMEQAEIDAADSDSDSSPEISVGSLMPLEYKIDKFLNVPNYEVVSRMKNQIAKSMPQREFNHLINFWAENFKGFPEFVVFFQYIQYHIERKRLDGRLTFRLYQHLVDAIDRREPIFQGIYELVSDIPLMCRFRFLLYDDNDSDFIYVNPAVLKLQMFALAGGLPSAVMHLFKKQRRWLITDLKNEFSNCEPNEFYRQLCNFLNDRPDLILLEAHKSQSRFPEMTVAVNDRISLRCCCLLFTLKDLNVAESLHLRQDYINSIKQFIPQRPHQQQYTR